MSQINIVFFKIGQNDQIAKDVVNFYKNTDIYNIEFCSSEEEVNQYLSTIGSGIFIFKVTSKEDLTGAVSILKAQSKLIKKGLIKPSCFLLVKNKKIDDILHKYGCGEILDPQITGKTFKFKMDFWTKALQTLLKKDESSFQLNKKSNGQTNNAKGNTNEPKVDFSTVNSLDLASDIWIIKNKTDYKKILRRYLIKMMGPSPFIGQWIELPNQSENDSKTWKFVFKDKEDEDYTKYIPEEGGWYFVGSKPEFDWKVNLWNFSGDVPHLYFYTTEKVVYSRVKYDKGTVLIAENSEFALMKEEMIVSSFEKNVNLSGEAEEEVDPTKIKDEELDSPELRAELDGESEKINSKMRGKSSTDKFEDDPMSGDIEGGEDLGGALSGKGKTDKLINDQLKGELEKSENVDDKKKKHNFESDKMSGYIDGENVAQKAQEKKAKDMTFKEEAIEGHWGGKIKPNGEKESGNLSGKNKTDNIKQEPLKGKLKEDSSEESDNLSGKGKTSHIKHKNLQGKLQNQEEQEQDDYGGEYETDYINNGPLKGKSKNEGNEESGHLKGKSKTDQLKHNPLMSKIIDNEELPNIDDDELEATFDIQNKNKIKTPYSFESEQQQNKKKNLNLANEQTPSVNDLKVDPGLVNDKVLEQPAAKMSKPGKLKLKIKLEDESAPLSKEAEPEIQAEAAINDQNANEPINDVIEPVRAKQNKINKQKEMEDILGSDLTKDSSSILNDEIGEKISPVDAQKKYNQIINNENVDNQVNTESGEVKVIVTHKSQSGSEIKFIGKFEDLFDQELIVNCPKNKLMKEDSVTVDIMMKYSGKKVVMKIDAKILDVEDNDETSDKIILKANNLDPNKVSQFMALYAERQESIFDFMKKAKGY